MATLKSIKNKYLSASDGDVLGVTTNTENISALSFKLATADSLSKFNLVDGFSDDYNDATGVDAAGSTGETRNATNNYYSGSATILPTGGTVTTVGDYRYHLFTADGDFIVPTGGTGNIEVVMIAGGAGGAKGGRTQDAGYGGGGGAGGLIHDTALPVTAQTYALVIGGGGDGAPYPSGAWGVNGGDSTGFGWTASGGGGGAPWNSNPGSAGGSGGQGGSPSGPGGAENQSSHTGSSGTRTAYGTAGATYSSNDHGGGAGSAGGAGGHALYIANFAAGSIGGNNGAGETPAGSYGWFGGGGGGSRTVSSYYSGAGAGMGQNDNVGENATGTWGSGGGGGGARYTGNPNGYAGGDGAGGCVAIRYASDTFQLAEDMTLQSNAFTAQTAGNGPTTARIILDEWAYKGAQTLNTDIKAYASRDGTNFTQVILADQGYLLGAGGINGNTQTMLHMDGADDGTTFTDSCTEGGNTAKVWTASGNAVTSTDQFKFGTASAYFDGTGDYISTPANSDFDFGSDPFTIDFWIRSSSLAASARVCGDLNSGGSLNSWEIIMNSTGNINFGCSTIGVACNGPSNITVNTWYHIAVTRVGNAFTVYVNGVAGSPHTVAGSLNANQVTSIGRSGEYNAMLYNGYIDEFRITPGVAVWTSAFTPPVGPYETSRRLLSGSVDISGQPAGTNMKYKVTTHNQAAAKQTRVYGTSMAWA